jgi:transposase-like protein
MVIVSGGSALEISSMPDCKRRRWGVEGTMNRQPKTWTIEQKLSGILSVLRGEESVARLARRHRVSEQQMYRRKAKFLEGGGQPLGGVQAPRAPIGISTVKMSSSSSSWARRRWNVISPKSSPAFELDSNGRSL